MKLFKIKNQKIYQYYKQQYIIIRIINNRHLIKKQMKKYLKEIFGIITLK